MPCIFCEESLGKINLKDDEHFGNGSSHEFCRLKALITLEQVNTSVVEKKKNLCKENFDGEANWSSVVNFNCMQMSVFNSVSKVHDPLSFLLLTLELQGLSLIQVHNYESGSQGQSHLEGKRTCSPTLPNLWLLLSLALFSVVLI